MGVITHVVGFSFNFIYLFIIPWAKIFSVGKRNLCCCHRKNVDLSSAIHRHDDVISTKVSAFCNQTDEDLIGKFSRADDDWRTRPDLTGISPCNHPDTSQLSGCAIAVQFSSVS